MITKIKINHSFNKYIHNKMKQNNKRLAEELVLMF